MGSQDSRGIIKRHGSGVGYPSRCRQPPWDQKARKMGYSMNDKEKRKRATHSLASQLEARPPTSNFAPRSLPAWRSRGAASAA